MESAIESNLAYVEENCSVLDLGNNHDSDHAKQNLISRLNRIEGQIRGLKRLIEDDRYCDDIITQISASQGALDSVVKILLKAYLKECLVEKIQKGDKKVLDEVLVTIQKLIKK